MSRTRTPPHLITLILMTALATLSLNMFVPSLANMAQDFQAPYSLIALSVSGYLGVSALLQMVLGPLSDRFGRRPVLLSGLTLFILASLGCLLAPDVETFLVARMLQAGVISGSALSSAIVRDTRPAQQAASTLGYIAMAMAIAPMLGPMIGGTLDQFFGWRASFVLYAVMGGILFSLCWFDLGETRVPSPSEGAQLHNYLRLIRTGRFWGYASCLAFSVGAFYAFIAGVPLVAKAAFGTSTALIGLYMGTITAGFFVGSFLSGRLAGQVPLPIMMMTGRVTACIGLGVGIGLFLSGIEHELALFGATIFVGIGNGLTTPSAHAGAMSVNPSLAGSAAGLAGAMTVSGGALLTLFTAEMLTVSVHPLTLLLIMLVSSLLGLLSALYVFRAERRASDRDKSALSG